MALQPFPYPQDSTVGDVPNGFFVAPDTSKKYILKRTWGLETHCTIPESTEGRGIIPIGNNLYAVIRRGSQSVLWTIDQSGGYSELGTITTTTTGPVWMKYNHAGQLGISDGTTVYVYTPATGLFVQNTDLNFPGSTTLDYQDGLGLFPVPNSNEWGFFNLYDFLTNDPLNFYSFGSKTGNIVAVVSFMREVYVLGVEGSEVWYFAGGDNSTADNPTFARNTAGVIEYGCGAIGTPNTADGTIVNWLSNQGQWIAAAGYQGRVVSNQMFDDAIKSMSMYSDARCFSWRDGGHVFTAMTFPSGQQTWLLDWTTQKLTKVQSYLSDGSGYGRWRLNCITKLNNVLYGLDYENGKVYRVSRDYFDDAGTPIRRVLYTTEFDGGNKDIEYGKMQLDMKMGIGLLGGTEPQVMMQRSRDSGETWSTEAWRSGGAIGEYRRTPPTWNRGGQSKKALYRFAFTDAVDWEIWGLDLEMRPLE